MEQVSDRRGNRPQTHYTLISNVLLFGYRELSDAEKLTYQAIASFDWADPDGKRKGYAFPAVETIAKLRGLDRRTVFRHLDRLQEAGLLKREQRPGRPTLLLLQGPSEREETAYLSTMQRVGSDTDVTPTRDSAVTPYKKEEEETDKTVNGVENVFEEAGSGWKRYRPKLRLTKEQRLKRDYIAGEILKVTKDPHSLGFYRKVASELPEQRVFKALSEVRQGKRIAEIRRTGAYFAAMIKGHAL